MKSIKDFMEEQMSKQTYGIFEEPVCEAIIATARFVQRWIPVSKELPEKSGFIIAQKSNGLKLGMYFDKEENTFEYWNLDQTNQVTHWRPIEMPVSLETLSESEMLSVRGGAEPVKIPIVADPKPRRRDKLEYDDENGGWIPQG